MIVLVEMITTRLSVVAYIFIIVTCWKFIKITFLEERTIFGRIGRIVTTIFFGIKIIKGCFHNILIPLIIFTLKDTYRTTKCRIVLCIICIYIYVLWIMITENDEYKIKEWTIEKVEWMNLLAARMPPWQQNDSRHQRYQQLGVPTPTPRQHPLR